MPQTIPLNRLLTLNELLARISPAGDPDRARHLRKSIECVGTDEQSPDPDATRYRDGARALLRLHLLPDAQARGAGVPFAHWHVAETEDFSPLWIRQAIIREMKQLAGHRTGVFLVTGLREAICPSGKRWTRARRESYAKIRSWIDEISARHASRNSELRILIL